MEDTKHSDSGDLLIHQQEKVLTITLNRPEKKNALTDAMAWGLVEAFEHAAAADDVWVVCITGSGGAFCAGADVAGSNVDYSPLSPQNQQLDALGWVGTLYLAARYTCEKPIIAGINGVAVGAGLGLAMAADIRFVTPSARLLPGYTRIGGSPDAGLSLTLTESLGYEQSMRFMLEDRPVAGKEAVSRGFAGELVAERELESRLLGYARQLCAWSPITTRLLKRTLSRAVNESDANTQLQFELTNLRTAFTSDDAKEARRAFVEKRSPNFKGC